MLDELAALHRNLPSLTVLYVTHDQSEALTLADHIGIMRDGKLVAFDTAQGLYRHPPNRFAAEFLGRSNVLPATSLRAVREGLAEVRFGETTLRGRNYHGLPEGSDCLVCVRPHDLRLVPAGACGNGVMGVVRSVLWLGELHSIELDVAGHTVRMNCTPMTDPPAPGAIVALHFDPADVTLVPEAGRHG
jgi:2-aminoethylphosphonate transport system ATP-binding protein